MRKSILFFTILVSQLLVGCFNNSLIGLWEIDATDKQENDFEKIEFTEIGEMTYQIGTFSSQADYLIQGEANELWISWQGSNYLEYANTAVKFNQLTLELLRDNNRKVRYRRVNK